MPAASAPRCLLRPLAMDDVPLRAAYLNLPEIQKALVAEPMVYTVEQQERFLKRQQSDPSFFVRSIEVDGQLAGGIGLREIVPRHKASLGYWLAPTFWGRGIMSEAILRFTADAFGRFALARIEAYVFEDNPASARVLEKAGFLCEGRLRKDVIKNGQSIDRFLYSKLV